MKSTPVKKRSARKSLCLFTNILDVKQKTEKRCIEAAKSKRKAVKVGTSLWTKKKNEKDIKKKRADQTQYLCMDDMSSPSCSITNF